MKNYGDGRVFQVKKADGTMLSRFWWCAYYLNGKEYRESTKTEDYETAQKFLKKKLKPVHSAQLGHSQFVAPSAGRFTVDALLDKLIEYKKLKGCRHDVTGDVKPIRARFGLMKATALTDGALVKNWMAELRAAGYRDAGVNRRTQLLGQAYSVAGLKYSRPDIPRLSEKNNVRQGFVTRAQLNVICGALPEYLDDLVRFAFLSSWRRGEIFALAWTWITGNTVTLPAAYSKNGRPRTLALEGELAELIARRSKKKKGPLVFHHAGRPIVDLRVAWRRAVKAAGVPGLIFHDLRRSGVREMILAGVSPQVAKTISGHETDSMLNRYCVLNTDDQRRAQTQRAEYVHQQQAEAAAAEEAHQQQVAAAAAAAQAPRTTLVQ